jgi:hypothetical protein
LKEIMRILRKNRYIQTRKRSFISVVILLLSAAGVFMMLHPVPTLTQEKSTSGKITFFDGDGNPLYGTMEITMADGSGGQESNVHSITWSDAPNVRIYFDAFETKNLSVDLRITGDSPDGRVLLEDHGATMPAGVDMSPPGVPVKYMEINTVNVSHSEANISIRYMDDELQGMDETRLSLYRYNGSSWTELSTRVDTGNNTASSTVESFSILSLGVRDEEEFDPLQDSIGPDPPEDERQIEVDALKTKGVAVKLKLNRPGSGAINLKDHGKKNPVETAPPGNAIKFVDISADDLDFESAEVRIQYTDDELGDAEESMLVIFHWSGTAWDALATEVDAAGNMLTAKTNSLSPFAVSQGTGGTSRILVATDRFVILGDNVKAGATAGSGFYLPRYGDTVGDSGYFPWTGEAVTIRAYALYLDENGSPVQGKNITFRFINPGGGIFETKYGITNSSGMASASSTVGNAKYYGNWQVTGSNASFNSSSRFIYNWWGCNYGDNGNNCDENHDGALDSGDRVTTALNSPYLEGYEKSVADIHDSGSRQVSTNTCLICHRSYDGSQGSSNTSADKTTPSEIVNGPHQGILCANSSCHGNFLTDHTASSPTMTIGSCYGETGCHSFRNDVSGKTTLAGTSRYSSPPAKSNYSKEPLLSYHTPSSTVPCILCHGPMHNITKPDESLRLIRNSDTESSHCTSCHSSYALHNSTVNCTLCHSDDVHAMRVFAQNASYITLNKSNPNPARGNCTSCHQNSSFYGVLKSRQNATSQSGRDPPLIQTRMNHSNDPLAGKKWNQTPGYWTNTSQLTWCKYCHGETMHKTAALGRPSLFRGSNIINASISSTSWCQLCHWQASSTYSLMTSTFNEDGMKVPPEITGNATFKPESPASDGTRYYNHSLVDYLDGTCRGCHGSGLSGTDGVTLFIHNVTEGGGGPDCISCHDYGKTGASRRVNNTAMKTGIHANLNKNATNASGISSDNKKCWGCHNSNGQQPTDMGDIFDDPYKCYDCHNSTAKPYANVSTAPDASEHFRGGEEIKASSSASDNSSSCLVCHNLSELKVPYIEDDICSSDYSLSSHYARNRTDLRTWNSGLAVNCSYCHQNSSTVFAVAMVDVSYNTSISNHSIRYNSSNPDCTSPQCHSTGWIHNSTLTKPDLTLQSSALCLSCHGNNGSGGTNYSGAVTGVREKHNNSIDCTSCHLNTSRDIHPVKYLQNINNTWSTSQTNAVNCSNCHQNSTFWPGAPIIPNPLKHSSNTSNGTIWGSYWTGANSACYYCHNNTKHNSTALGSISSLLSSANVRNGTLTNTRWCADCHYNTSNPTYKGNLSQWSPTPPLITVNNTGKSYWVNHSSFLSSGYNDSTCIPCHALNGSFTVTSLNYSHSLDPGVDGGADCKSCHDVGGLAGPGKLVNFSGMNDTNAIHKYMNKNTATALSAENKKCWACHGNANQPSDGHPSNYKTPRRCPDCHLPNSMGGGNHNEDGYFELCTKVCHFTIPLYLRSHLWNGTNIKTPGVTTCYGCHNKSEMVIPDPDPDGPGTVYQGENGGNNSPSHYGKKRTDLRTWNSGTTANCSYCHQNTSTAFMDVMVDPVYNSSIQNHSKNLNSPACYNPTCHGSGKIHDTSLTRPAFNPGSTSPYCQNCHAAKQKHNGTLDCSRCHINQSTNDTIHPVKYLQMNRTFITSNTSAVNCTNCHQGTGLTNFSTAPIVPRPLNHSSNLSNGTIWGTYWTTEEGACFYCHNDTRHNATALGKISVLQNSYNVKNGSLATTGWCADCHYNDTENSDYKGDQWSPVPPLVTINNTGKSYWINHSRYFNNGYNDTLCKDCHEQNGSYTATSLNYSHSLDPGILGGADCQVCHDLVTGLKKGAPVGINFSAANSSAHYGMNGNNATSQGYSAVVGACWACHSSNGNATSGHTDRYSTPAVCTECHLGTGTYNSSAYSAIIVYQHYYSGMNITAGNSTSNISSCINCHENVSEMILYNNDTDYGIITGDGIRLTGGNMSFYHYGSNRSDLRSLDSGKAVNCSYCHQNVSTLFAAAMVNPADNSTISNHSQRYNSSNPGCTVSQCHNSSWMHNSTLTRPDLILPNTTFCLSCHGSNGTGGTNYSGAVTGIREMHNGSVYCTECHLNNSQDIHPVKYLQPNATYNMNNSTAVTCITCHQTSEVDSELLLDPSRIPSPMYHSDNTSSGTGWGTYWNSSSTVTACIYCHNDTKHNATALGRPASWKGNNTVNSSISSGTWCGSCHYQNYADGGNDYSDMVTTFTSASLSVPPEITNGTYAQDIYNRSGYYNHSLTNYSDENCRLCHGMNISSDASISLFIHNITWGNCTDCHYSFEVMNSTNRPDRYVDSDLYSQSLHGSLSCSNCHTKGHRNIGARKACEDCHAVQADPVTDRDRHNITATPSTYTYNGTGVVNITDCTTCHSAALYNTAVTTYGYWKQKDCDYCHTYPEKYYE